VFRVCWTQRQYMLFNSTSFLVFLPIVFLLYWFVFNKSLTWQNILILIASYVFYGWWSEKFLLLLIGSTLLDYLYGFGVGSNNKTKAKFFLWLSILNNLGILGIFKYYNFFALQFQQAFELAGIHTNPVLLQIALPVGLSFYTFHGMSYVFDIYRGVRKPVTNLVDYSVFVSFFPLLVAGPIERANHLLPQVQSKRTFNYAQAVEGCRLILWGLFKKVVIADSLAVVADQIFNNYQDYNAFTLLIGAVAFAFQIYGDFSGYSDIALGTAKLFGFELLSNFKFPYFSRNIAEFWRRWHISLSSWFKDYLYIPLGGSRKGKARAVLNTFIIFLVSGFWHGASWNFIAWGFIHACGFLPLLLLNRNRQYLSDVVAQSSIIPTIKEALQMLSTFAFVTFAWIFFRSESLRSAWGYVQQIIVSAVESPKQFLTVPQGLSSFAYILPLLIIDWNFRHNERQLMFKNAWYKNMFYIVLGILVLFYFGKRSSFIYFQF
jgi:alginate O-acetyltransferase complex protein AlgI